MLNAVHNALLAPNTLAHEYVRVRVTDTTVRSHCFLVAVASWTGSGVEQHLVPSADWDFWLRYSITNGGCEFVFPSSLHAHLRKALACDVVANGGTWSVYHRTYSPLEQQRLNEAQARKSA